MTRRDVLLGALVALATGAAYLPALGVDFVADDYFILARVRDYGGLAAPGAYFSFGFFDYYRPLGFLSHALDWQVWGLDARGFHLTSLVLHVINTLLVFALARRVSTAGVAAVAALLFGWHAGSHETVYWIAARFDLLATGFVLLSVLALGANHRLAHPAGAAAFACALLSKESAAALPLIVAAWDVVIARRRPADVVRRAVPLLAVAAGYVVLRSYGAGLEADGGRLPKLVLLVGGMTALVLVAHVGIERVTAAAEAARLRLVTLWLVGLGAAVMALAVLPATAAFVREKLGFVAYAGWVLASPVALPSPPVWVFLPGSALEALPGLAAVLAVLAAIWAGRRWLAGTPAALFGVCFTAAALVPVLSMTGGARYLYLASAGAALLASLLVAALQRHRPMVATAVVVIWIGLSGVTLARAADAWRWAGALNRQGLTAMTAEGPGCEVRDVVMVTAPVGQRGVYSNLLWDGLAVRSTCPPASIATLLRVVDVDADVVATRPSAETIDLRVPGYAGQFVGSHDLRRFDVPLPAGHTGVIETPLGRVDTWPEGAAQRFRITLTPEAVGADFFVYGNGEMRALGAGR